MKSVAIDINNLSKVYQIGSKQPYYSLRDTVTSWFSGSKQSSKSFYALRNINLEVKVGEVLGIIGRNGAGKSTLLKILSRVTAPSKGVITVSGRVGSLLEVGTGFHPELSGRENIYLNGVLMGMSRAEVSSHFKEIVDFSGLEEFIDTPVKKYSSGMYVRLAFAVAAHLEPEIMIIDEVLAVGDLEFQQRCLGKIRDISKSGERTVVFISHNLALVDNICDRVVLLDKGKKIMDGKTKPTIAKYMSLTKTNTTNLTNRKDRIGSGEICVTSVELVDDAGHKVDGCKSGDTISIRLNYTLKGKPIKNLLAGVLLRNSMGVPIFNQYNQLTNDDFGTVAGDGVIECQIPQLPLVPGRYSVTYSLMKQGGVGGSYYDNIENAFDFQVAPGNFFASGVLPRPEHGSVLVRARWKVRYGKT